MSGFAALDYTDYVWMCMNQKSPGDAAMWLIMSVVVWSSIDPQTMWQLNGRNLSNLYVGSLEFLGGRRSWKSGTFVASNFFPAGLLQQGMGLRVTTRRFPRIDGSVCSVHKS